MWVLALDRMDLRVQPRTILVDLRFTVALRLRGTPALLLDTPGLHPAMVALLRALLAAHIPVILLRSSPVSRN